LYHPKQLIYISEAEREYPSPATRKPWSWNTKT
jgi:hypothetical protein